jgi:hypothetical protein
LDLTGWPASGYGIRTGGVIPASPTTSELNSIPSPNQIAANADKVWHPDSAMFWAGALVAVAFGLAGFSTSTKFRVGKGKAGASFNVGETK